MLALGMVRILYDDFERITEDRHGLRELDTVLGRVLRGLRWIPFELHGPSLPILLWRLCGETPGFSYGIRCWHAPPSAAGRQFEHTQGLEHGPRNIDPRPLA